MFFYYKNSVKWYVGTSLLLSIVFVLFTSCKIEPQQANTPTFVSGLKYEISYFAGSPITGHTSVDSNSLRAEESLAVTMSWAVIKQLPKNLLNPAESQTRMIKIFPAQKPVYPVAQLTRGTRFGSIVDEDQFIDHITNDESDRGIFIGKLHGVLPPRITTRFSFTKEQQLSDKLEIQIFNNPQTVKGETEESQFKSSLEIALVANGKIKQNTIIDKYTDEEDKDSDFGGEDVQITETVFFKTRPFEERDKFAIILPIPFTVEDIKALAVIFDIRSPTNKDRIGFAMHSLYFNQCLEYLVREGARDKLMHATQADIEWAGLEESIQSLYSPTNKRRALLHLAQQTNSALVKDIALSGTELIVENLCQEVINEYVSGSITNSEILGWMLERTAYSLLANLLSTDQATPELEEILIRHTGQVGRYISTLEELIDSSKSTEELQRNITRENFIYLEDISPAARTRAFDWLSVRGKAPDKYDPLSPLKERRDALSRIEIGFD